MNRYRTPPTMQDQDGFELPVKLDRHDASSPSRADRFERHRNHHREHLCHDIRCQEADREIRDMLRRY